MNAPTALPVAPTVRNPKTALATQSYAYHYDPSAENRAAMSAAYDSYWGSAGTRSSAAAERAAAIARTRVRRARAATEAADQRIRDTAGALVACHDALTVTAGSRPGVSWVDELEANGFFDETKTRMVLVGIGAGVVAIVAAPLAGAAGVAYCAYGVAVGVGALSSATIVAVDGP